MCPYQKTRNAGCSLAIKKFGVVHVTRVPAFFVIAQPDLGSGLVYIVIALATLFVAGASWRHFAGLFALGAVAIRAFTSSAVR